MAFRCENCNGSVIFDIASQQMRCLHCDSVFPPESFRVRDAGAPVPGGRMAEYECGGCGAVLESTDDSMIGFCPYCGGQSMLRREKEEAAPLEGIIPFRITREECGEAYRRFARKVPYLPREMCSSAFLEKFTGIYMPFYTYDVDVNAASMEGHRTVESNARYSVANTYLVTAAAGSAFHGAAYDGSAHLDDELSARCLPFDASRERAYTPAYLAGFYADTATVPGTLYYADAREYAAGAVKEQLAWELKRRDMTPDSSTGRVSVSTSAHHPALFPLWFLTWRKGDRVAYAVINGDSGRVVSDLPLNAATFLWGSLAAAAALFAVLELLFQPTPLLTSFLSLAAALLMAVSIRRSGKSAYDKATPANDKGWRSAAGTLEEPEGGKTRRGAAAAAVLAVLCAALLLGGWFWFAPSVSVSYPALPGAAVLIYVFASVGRLLAWRKASGSGAALGAMLLVLLAVLVNLAVVIWSPVNDGWYYIGDGACILALLLASLGMIRAYNLQTTRPLPKLFGRKEV